MNLQEETENSKSTITVAKGALFHTVVMVVRRCWSDIGISG